MPAAAVEIAKKREAAAAGEKTNRKLKKKERKQESRFNGLRSCGLNPLRFHRAN